MLATNIAHRVFRLAFAGKTASGYTIEKGDRQYLVSAAHTFDGAAKVDELAVFHEKSWKTLSVNVVFNDPDHSDTIVFGLPHDISVRLEVKRTTAHVLLGSWAYILGFPLGLYTPDKGINANFPLPFVKAGLVSSMANERHGITQVYLDGHHNKGFSGAPVVWYPPNQPTKVQIIGTISGYLTESATHNETLDDLESHQVNAGITVAYSINDLEQFLR